MTVALASLPMPSADEPRLVNVLPVNETRLAAETCTAAGSWYQLVRARSNISQPREQLREGVGGTVVVRALDERAVLLVGVTVGRRAEPGRAGELDALEREARDRLVVRAADADQRLQSRQLDAQAVGVDSVGGLVVELAFARVDVPLPGLGEEAQRVVEVPARPGEERVLDRVPAPGVVVPGRLRHRDLGRADALHGRVAVGEVAAETRTRCVPGREGVAR